jgi:protein-tyrosine phosphatase
MAEVLLRRRLAERNVTASVDSAGFLGAGHPAVDEAIEAAAAMGLNLVGRYSQTVTPELIAAADLIIAMERQHVVELAALAQSAWPRVFQLRDLVRRAETAGRRARDEPFAAWLAELGAARTTATVLTAPLSDDIDDPMGGPRSGYDRTWQLLDELLTRLAGLISAT